MTQQEKTRSGQWHLWLMIIILGGVISAGFLMFPKTEEAREKLLGSLGTTNHGEFVLPAVSMKSLQLKNADQTPWVFDEQKVKWRMIIPGYSTCHQECQDMLYLTRQVHISLGKYSRRFERIYINFDGQLDSDTQKYLKLHPFLHVLNGSQSELTEILAETNTPLNVKDAPLRAYMVDQNGLIMMSYTLADDGHEIIEDIEHLMKYSPG